MQDSKIDVLIRGSSLNGKSSLELGWEGLTLERRNAEPQFRVEETLDQHYGLLWCGLPTVANRAYRNNRFTRVVKQPGTLSLGIAGNLPAVDARSPYDVIAFLISPQVADQVTQESEWGNRASLHEHLGITDKPLTCLIQLAAQETLEGGASGRLYGESIALAIIARFVMVASQKGLRTREQTALPGHLLRRVLDKIGSEYSEDLGLAEMAIESGYSRSHFLRMFRAATGRTPHAYLLQVRLERVRHELLNSRATLAEIANATGFSSHSHMTRAFHTRYGVLPSVFRRIK
ncbi:helix-turn-helix domain-containing protein [Pseudomonas sp. NPDC096950]|uniref:helix-turn-helix domain-containing protein n=1 Tax=Pseudomonas sp. NPDC096950 TaxID=3364485 RepID=UPI00383AAB19